jgi:hypothetical protein
VVVGARGVSVRIMRSLSELRVWSQCQDYKVGWVTVFGGPYQDYGVEVSIRIMS